MPDLKSGTIGAIGGAILGLSLGATMLSPDKADMLETISVNEIVASKMDSLTQRVVACELAPNSDTTVVKCMNADGKVISERKITGEHTSIRAEDILRVPPIPDGATLRLVAFVDNTVAAEWSTVSTDSQTSAMAQIVVYRR